jgi:hypothetical protein
LISAFAPRVIGHVLAGFLALCLGPRMRGNVFHHLHVAPSFGWQSLLRGQLILLRRRAFHHHHAIGLSIFIAGPLFIATSVLLTAYVRT